MSTRMQIEHEQDLRGDTHDLVIRLKLPRSDLVNMEKSVRESLVAIVRDPVRSNAAILGYLAGFVRRIDGEEGHAQPARSLTGEGLIGGRALDLEDEKEKL
ncbi:hypothetical protein J2J97_32495 (plasmid) [Rhizobium bangladeshense]|uniref:hypothetical protein n=1 Tax=Rhizobium bangladeshense TaxID=1138189 RepID=UPI001A997315|nr:hypothetical protein [Rhizobium bangladeshense]QSY98625.1 hypothetical protein J2J97_32495 [Rhizobium bangladeshense]